MQQQNPSDQDSRLRCETHKGSIEFLYFGDIGKLKSRLLCSKCIIKVVNSEQLQPSLILLDEFLLNPGNQIMQITRVNGSIVSPDDSKQAEKIEEIEQALSNFEDIVKQQIQQIRQNIIYLKTWFGQVYEEISQNLKLNDIVQLIKQLREMESDKGTNDLVELEEKLNYVSENLNKCALEKAQGNQKILFDQFSNNFKTIQNVHEMLSKQTFDRVQNMLGLGMPAILYEDIGQFPQIHEQISEGKQIQYQLLYQGTRDGLFAHAYWTKCINKSHLLTIMTSKNGNRFGVYSPCQLQFDKEDKGQWVNDPTMKSFLFQYNKKEICYCLVRQGPTYGEGYDFYLEADFQIGYASLGWCFDVSPYNIIDKKTHFFGAENPHLKELKVYQVIF